MNSDANNKYHKSTKDGQLGWSIGWNNMSPAWHTPCPLVILLYFIIINQTAPEFSSLVLKICSYLFRLYNTMEMNPTLVQVVPAFIPLTANLSNCYIIYTTAQGLVLYALPRNSLLPATNTNMSWLEMGSLSIEWNYTKLLIIFAIFVLLSIKRLSKVVKSWVSTRECTNL